MMKRRRGSNGVAAPNAGAVAGVLELAALDDAGPALRSAIYNSPLPVLAYPVVAQIIEFNDKIEKENEERAAKGWPLRPYLDLRDPVLDLRLAQAVLDHAFTSLLTDTPEDRARMGMKMLKGRMSPRTARENAKADRLARRFRRW